MLDKKNVIFIPPLAEELKKLHQDYTEGEDKDLYEVLDVSSLPEANQLIPSLGPALILTSAAKTCAMMLKANKKYLKQFQSKVILVTPQQIPDNTINKLMKVGLNDYVQCPVNEKSLHYKCNLLLKSIKGTQIEEDVPQTNQEKLLSSEFDNVAIDTSSKQRIEKGILEEHEKGEIKKSQVEEVNLNIISSTMDNKTTRGAMDLKLDFAEEPRDQSTQKKTQQSSTNDELELLQKDIQLDLEQAEQQRKEQTIELEIQRQPDNEKQPTKKDGEDNRAMVIGEKDSLQLAIEQEDQNNQQTAANKEETAPNSNATQHLSIDKEKKLPPQEDGITLQIDATKKDASPTPKEQEEDELQKIKDELEAELEQDQQKKSQDIMLGIDSSPTHQEEKQKKEQEDNSPIKSPRELQIGQAAKEKRTKTKEQTDTKTKVAAVENILTMEKPKHKKHPTTTDQEEPPTKKYHGTEVTLDYRRKRKSQASNEESDPEVSPKHIALQIDTDQDKHGHKKKKQETNERASKEVNLELEQDSSSSTKDHQQDKEKRQKKEVTLQIGKSKHGFTEKVDLDVMKGESAVEHLEKRMKSRKHHGELKIDFDKKKRGEGDTLDYSKIKKEYKELAHALNSLDPEALEKLKKKKEDKLFEKQQIFEPHSKGVEHLISIYETYENSLKSNDDVIYAMAQILENDFSAMVAIFILQPAEQQYKERFSNFEEITKKNNGGQPLGQADKWETIKLVNLEQWQKISQFTWKDETFQSEEQEFLFPYFQDNQKFGFAVIRFNQAIAKNRTGLIETIVESIRGVIIEEYHIELDGGIKERATVSSPSLTANPIASSTSLSKSEAPPPSTKKKKGFFSKLFG